MKPSEYDDNKYAQSRAEVSRGGFPLRRTSIPGTIKPLPESLVLTRDSNFGSINICQPQLVMLDVETMQRLGRVMDEDEHHILKVSARNPFITSVAIVTDALSRAYWSPDTERSGDPDMWAEAFRLDTKNIDTPKKLFRLAAEPLSGAMKTSVNLNDSDVIEMMMKGAAVYPGSYEALSLLAKLEEIAEIGSYMLRSDYLLRDRYLLTGEVVKLTNPLLDGAEIACDMSSPCKLRAKKAMVAIIGREEFSTEIVDMSYSKGTGLKANIKAVGKGSFITQFMSSQGAYMTPKAYTGNSFFRSSAVRPRRTGREVPLDITLAALGER